MTPEEMLAILNRWAVIEYFVDPDDNKKWNRVYINIPTTMDGKQIVSNKDNPAKLLEVLAESLKEAESNKAERLPEEIVGSTYLPVDELPERWQGNRRKK
jgi:hypothetical protein